MVNKKTSTRKQASGASSSKHKRISSIIHFPEGLGVRSWARCAASLFVLAGLLSGQAPAQANVLDELSPSMSKLSAAGSAVKESASWVQQALTPNGAGAKVMGQGFYDLAESMGHLFHAGHSGVKSTSKFLDGLGFGSGAHDHLVGRGLCLVESGCQTLNATGHLAKALGKFGLGLYRTTVAGPVQLAYENPGMATVLAASLVGYDATFNQGQGLVKSLLDGGGALQKGFQTFGKTVADPNFWQQTVKCSGLSGHIDTLKGFVEGVDQCPLYDAAIESSSKLPMRVAEGVSSAYFKGLETLVQAMGHAVTSGGNALYHSGIGPAFLKGATNSIALGTQIATYAGGKAFNLVGQFVNIGIENAPKAMSVAGKLAGAVVAGVGKGASTL